MWNQSLKRENYQPLFKSLCYSIILATRDSPWTMIIDSTIPYSCQSTEINHDSPIRKTKNTYILRSSWLTSLWSDELIINQQGFWTLSYCSKNIQLYPHHIPDASCSKLKKHHDSLHFSWSICDSPQLKTVISWYLLPLCSVLVHCNKNHDESLHGDDLSWIQSSLDIWLSHYYLVVEPPLWKIWTSVGTMQFPIHER